MEITETFFIVLTSTAPYVRLGLNKTVVSINDSDTTTVELEHLSYSVGEAEGTLSVCVVLGAEIEREATVQLTTGDGTARSGPDFTQTDVELTFQSLSSTRLCTSIAITNDNAVEDTEEFKIFLRTADDSLYVTGENGSVIISDDDRVAVSLERGEVSVEEEEGTVEMCVQLLGVVEKNVEVSLALVADTAHGEPNSIVQYYACAQQTHFTFYSLSLSIQLVETLFQPQRPCCSSQLSRALSATAQTS